MIQAQVEGVIDYSKARLNDPSWWKRLSIITRAVERKNSLTLHDASFRYQLALAANSGLTNDSFGSVQERAQELFWDIVGNLRPWEGSSYQERKKREFTDSRQQYIDAFGVDPLDPEFKEWEADQIRRLESGEFNAGTQESALETVTRRMRERLQQGR